MYIELHSHAKPTNQQSVTEITKQGRYPFTLGPGLLISLGNFSKHVSCVSPTCKPYKLNINYRKSYYLFSEYKQVINLSFNVQNTLF